MNWISYVGIFIVFGSLGYIVWQLIMKLVALFTHSQSHKGFKKIGIGLICLVIGFGLALTYKETKADIAENKKQAKIESRKEASEKESSKKAKSISLVKTESKKRANRISTSKSKAESKSKAISTSKAESTKKESKAKASSNKAVKKESIKKEKKESIVESAKKVKTKKEKQSSKASLNKKAQAAFKDIGGLDEYPLVSKIEVNHNGNKVTGVSVWGDESLASVSLTLLKHYFSAGAQVGNRLLGSTTGKVPFIQVYAGSQRVARSAYTNNSEMKDLR